MAIRTTLLQKPFTGDALDRCLGQVLGHPGDAVSAGPDRAIFTDSVQGGPVSR